MSETYLTQLQTAFPNLPFQAQYPLAEQTYFKLGGPAEIYSELSDLDDCTQVFSFCHTHQIPLTIFGGASNTIVSDSGIPGLVLKITNSTIVSQGTTLTAGAGTKTALLVRASLDSSLTGLEYFLGVPGNVGGAIFNNAHYLQHLIGETVARVEVATPDGERRWLTQAECAFGYDRSRFQTSGELILSAEFSLKTGSTEASQELIKQATLYRAQTQPLGMPSSGCIFQNVPNTPELQKQFPQFKDKAYIGGGFLIDQAGLKGSREGDIEVSHKHAAFFVNHGQGTATQVQTLIARVQARVKELFGVQLQLEVFFLGR